ncbi:hypothetical protein [Vibrio crassostreae]|uniref:hypothetical protein n=1 Tax=Vibrio crassostreae TaxID=246167 RepID=UPI000F4F2B63|nr:hypothetical protein [Vibrio crassostreae]RPF04737.1 hypothetical protein EDB14_2712 [Vibrio crassostreae]TCN68698.1 hypothetical protein EDB60_10894 [Vibrio crassostreae]TCV13885.1 hypothetical protein EDB16_104184 [Vibrio crassostreae]TWD67048.1 hypothetical protein FB444_103103 [Vibrio crassostreae]CAK3463188.1 conserved hypothetical protein [Vibrio crassostreae]
MEISDWFKVPALLSAFVVLSKFLYDVASGKLTKLREEYRFAKELLNDIESGSLHPYVKQKGYQALVGTTNISTEEVEYILTLKDSVQCLNDYVLAREYLERVESRGNTQLHFKSEYQSDNKRLALIIWYVFWYFIFAMFVASPFILNIYYDFTVIDFLVLVTISASIFAFPAWRSLKRGARISRGQHLVKNQKSHSWELLTQT